MAFVVRSARVVDQKLAEARARLRRVEPEERPRVGLVGRGPAEGGGRGGEEYDSHLLVPEGPRDYDHQQDDEEDRVDPGIIRGLAVVPRGKAARVDTGHWSRYLSRYSWDTCKVILMSYYSRSLPFHSLILRFRKRVVPLVPAHSIESLDRGGPIQIPRGPTLADAVISGSLVGPARTPAARMQTLSQSLCLMRETGITAYRSSIGVNQGVTPHKSLVAWFLVSY